MPIKRKLATVIFRLKVRKALSDSTNEQVYITYEESKKMCEKRKIKL